MRGVGRVAWILVALAAGMILLVGCGGGDDEGDDTEAYVAPEERTAQGEPPTASELVGVWSVDETGGYGAQERLVRFSPDGSFAIDDRGMLDTTPAAAGNYEVEGREIIFKSAGSDICVGGDSWTFEAGIPEEDRLHIVVTEDAEPPCNEGVGAQWFLTKTSDQNQGQ